MFEIILFVFVYLTHAVLSPHHAFVASISLTDVVFGVSRKSFEITAIIFCLWMRIQNVIFLTQMTYAEKSTTVLPEATTMLNKPENAASLKRRFAEL